MKKRDYFLFLLLSFLTNFAYGQEVKKGIATIQTDRPSRGTKSPFVLPKGYLQLETGFSYFQAEIDLPEPFLINEPNDPILGEMEYPKFKVFHLPGFIIKYGLGNRIEARIQSTLQHSATDYGKNSFPVSPGTYLDNWTVGIKYQALEFHDSKGILSLLAETNIPGSRTGKHLLESEWVVHGSLISAYAFNDWFSLTAKAGVKGISDVTKKQIEWALLPSFNVSKRLLFYAEWYGERRPFFNFQTWREANKNFHKIDGGFLFLLKDNLMLDISGGLDLREENVKNSFTISTGISWRTKIL